MAKAKHKPRLTRDATSFTSFPTMSATADTRGHPMFRSVVMRFVWRAYVWRLTQAGRWLVWPTLGFLTYTSASLEFQTFIPMSYVFGIWAVALIFGIYFCPKGTLAVFHSDRVCAGEHLPVEFEFENRSRYSLRDAYVLAHRLPPGIEVLPDEGAALSLLKTGEKQRVKLTLKCMYRGEYNLSGFRVESDFPFGIFRSYHVFNTPRALLVYPRFNPLSRMELASGRRYQPGGVALASVLGDSVDFVGNREYREGDNVRDIDWHATARLNVPIVREYKEEYLLRVAVILDTHVPKKSHVLRAEAFEHAVSISAAVGDYLARQEYIVDLFAAGPNLYHLMAGRSLAYLDQILDILACVKESPNEPFATIEPELTETLSRISSVVCVFIDWTDSRRTFVEKLLQQGVGVKVIVVDDGHSTLKAANDPLVGTVLQLSDLDLGVTEL